MVSLVGLAIYVDKRNEFIRSIRSLSIMSTIFMIALTVAIPFSNYLVTLTLSILLCLSNAVIGPLAYTLAIELVFPLAPTSSNGFYFILWKLFYATVHLFVTPLILSGPSGAKAFLYMLCAFGLVSSVMIFFVKQDLRRTKAAVMAQ